VASSVSAVAMASGISAVTGPYALERHDQETGCSQEQRECVQVHVSIEPLRGRSNSSVRRGPTCRYAPECFLLSVGKFERRRTARSR
jgi:hypothetical protein